MPDYSTRSSAVCSSLSRYSDYRPRQNTDFRDPCAPHPFRWHTVRSARMSLVPRATSSTVDGDSVLRTPAVEYPAKEPGLRTTNRTCSNATGTAKPTSADSSLGPRKRHISAAADRPRSGRVRSATFRKSSRSWFWWRCPRRDGARISLPPDGKPWTDDRVGSALPGLQRLYWDR